MLKLREYIDIDVFGLDRSKNLDQATFQLLKKNITQHVETQEQCHCTICGINLFDTIFVFDGYSSFCIGCESKLGEIKRSVYVFVCIGCQEVQSPQVSENIPEQQEIALINQISREQIPSPEIVMEEEMPELQEQNVELSPSLSNPIIQPNQEKVIDQSEEKLNRLKTLMLRERYAIFEPIKQELRYFNDQYYDIAIGYTPENIKEEDAAGLMHLMKGWTLRDALIDKRLAKFYGVNQELKEKFGLQESIELSEDKFHLESDQSSDSKIFLNLKKKTEELSQLAQFYIRSNPENSLE